MAREALIPVSVPMIQEEALQIALKLNVTGFIYVLIYLFIYLIRYLQSIKE